MSRISWRRAVAAVVLGASAVLLSACGSSSTESQLNPARLISFGDAFSDVGQANGAKYTVNDTAINHWLQQVASRYGKTITASASGGTGYARLGARVAGKPSVTGDTTTLTVTEQIDAFLAAGGAFTADDLVFIDGGMSDALFESKAFLAGTQTADQAIANVRLAGQALAALAKRVADAGAQHVVVVGAIQLGYTPWGAALPQAGTLTEISRNLNDAFLIDAVKLGNRVLYLDAPYYFRYAADNPNQLSLSNARDVVCTSIDQGAGIGIGAGEVNSALCSPSTILPGATYDSYMFADKLYTTPSVQRQFGDYAYGRISNRW